MTDRAVRVLFDEATIAARVDELAREIAEKKPLDPLIVAILNGSFVFAADLMRALDRVGVSPHIEFLRLKSYGAGTESAGTVSIVCDINDDVAGRDVFLVDDILDTGRTIAFARDLLLNRGAKRVSLTVLLDKPSRRVVDVAPDHCGFTCPDQFIFGYGIDMGHNFRHLPFIGFLETVGTGRTETGE